MQTNAYVYDKYPTNCVDNGHRYVGVFRAPRRRFKEHLRHPPQRMLANHIKYQPFTFPFPYEILEENRFKAEAIASEAHSIALC